MKKAKKVYHYIYLVQAILVMTLTSLASSSPLIVTSPCSDAIILCCPSNYPSNLNFESSHRSVSLFRRHHPLLPFQLSI
jgi:hypothetical protein